MVIRETDHCTIEGCYRKLTGNQKKFCSDQCNIYSSDQRARARLASKRAKHYRIVIKRNTPQYRMNKNSSPEAVALIAQMGL